MTLQEIFNKAVGSLLKQGARSESEFNDRRKCAYRSDVGCCAVGHLIPDEIYRYEMDANASTSVLNLLQDFPEVNNFILADNVTRDVSEIFLVDLQHIHDTSDPCEWPDQLKRIAERYDLVWKFD